MVEVMKKMMTFKRSCAHSATLSATLSALDPVKEAEDITKRWQEYTEELYKKDLHDPGNHDGVITHLEPDILECEVKWTLGDITMNKPSGSYGIQLSYHKS